MHMTTTRTRRLSDAQLRKLRAELEREAGRLNGADLRRQAFTEALRRLDEGVYGECFQCGNHIPYDRLAVLPETLYCVSCGGK